MNITKSATKAQLTAHIATLENEVIVRGLQLEALRLELSIARAPKATPQATSDFKARCAAARALAMAGKCVVKL